MTTPTHTVVQLLALACVIAGVYLLAGLAWALFIGGGSVLATSVLAELGRPAPSAPTTKAGA